MLTLSRVHEHPLGIFKARFASLSATDLGGIVVKEALVRAGVAAADVDEVIMGNVLGAGVGQAPARQAALKGGLPASVAGGNREQGLWFGFKSCDVG